MLFSLQGLPPFLKLDFGLFSAVWLPLEPTIPFSHWSAVSHPKSRDFRLPEPTIPFSTWSAVSHPTSGHDVTRPIRSQSGGHLGALYYYDSSGSSDFIRSFQFINFNSVCSFSILLFVITRFTTEAVLECTELTFLCRMWTIGKWSERSLNKSPAV